MSTTRQIPLNASYAGPVYSITGWSVGDDVTLVCTMVDGTTVTGWSVEWSMAANLGGTVLFKVTATCSGTVITVAVPSADTSMQQIGRYPWDLRRIDAGYQAQLAYGWVDLGQNVTPVGG